jgi:hypothetical protein
VRHHRREAGEVEAGPAAGPAHAAGGRAGDQKKKRAPR